MMWILVTMLACGGSEPAADAPASPDPEPVASEPAEPTNLTRRDDVDIDALAEALDEGATVIDVRTQAEWDAGHVPGAIHVPLDQLSPQHAALVSLDRSEPVYFICETGGRSSSATDRMAAAGYSAVNVEGGTSAWRAAGRPVE